MIHPTTVPPAAIDWTSPTHSASRHESLDLVEQIAERSAPTFLLAPA
jgi:hypothetical protein